jgi:hypothetical protein
MKKITLLLFLLVNIIWSHAQSTCANPVIIPGAGLYIVAGINGTTVASPICADNGPVSGIGRSEWFRYTPTQNHTVTITTDITQNTPRIDTRFHVYSGSCGALTCYAGDDDSGQNLSSSDTFTVTANTTYLIAFDNKWTANGFTFQLIEAPFVPQVGNSVSFTSQSIPTINSEYNNCVVDLNGDYLDDIVGVSSTNIKVHIQNANGSFSVVNYPTTAANSLPSWSIAAGDYNRDGINDLMYGGGSAITFMKSNGTGYIQDSFSQYVFAQRTNFIDLNNDGHLDAFSCHDVQPNVYFMNDGSSNLTFFQSNVTPNAMQLGIFPSGGNYGSIWIDYDNDGDQDLFIAKCRGGSSGAKYNELHRNNGDGTFTDVSIVSNLRDPLQTWSSAWGDFDNDGDMDVIVGASSFTDGTHKYMRNNGDGTFTNITTGSGWDTNTSTSIEHIAYDFNNDGFIDVMGGGNKIMYNLGNGAFASGATGFGINGGVGDLNNDGFLDFQAGSTIRLNNGNSNNWIKFALQGVQSNRNGIGARIEIYGAWGKQIRDARSGEGFRYMSSLNIHFGIGTATAVTQAIIRWPSGIVDVINNPTINQMLNVVEGSSLNVAQYPNSAFTIFPNPATELLNINVANGISIKTAEVFDLNGRSVIKSEIIDNAISVSKLSTGTYILILSDSNGNDYSQKFIKE